MASPTRHWPKLFTPAVALLAVVAVAAGCTSEGNASTETAAVATTVMAAAPPDVVGSWEGSYKFPTIDGALVDSPLLVVIERQEGSALWGFEQFNDEGQVIRIPFTGSFDADGQSFGLAATGLTIIGTMTGADQMNLRFFKVSDPPTSFQVMVERTSS